jgi:anti-sigma B factor antagonist
MECTFVAPGEDGFEGAILEGDCDLYSAPAFAKAALSRIASGAKRLRLDLSRVEYLDSSGVGALIRILQEARRRGCELRFVGVGGSPRKVLKMTNVLNLMHEENRP